MIVSINGKPTEYIAPRYINTEIIVGIDSSKTNSAFVVRDSSGNVIEYVEFDGSKDGTSEVDVLRLCQEQRRVLKQLFKDSKPIIVGIENIITKDTKSKEMGISIHMSRFKITAVFMSFISFFQDTFNITPTLVNNWTWKSTVLPEEFRSKEYVKGSLAYFKYINSKYQYCSDDVTDALCISEYLCIVNNVAKGHKIGKPEVERYPFKHFLASTDIVKRNQTVLFIYNKEITLKQNAAVMSNMLKEGEIGAAEVPIDILSIEEIYELCVGKFKNKETMLSLIVKRL